MTRPPDDEQLHEFRMKEYEILAALVKSRDERVDKFITVYLAIVSAPFAMWAVVLKTVNGTPTATPPVIVAWLMLLCGVLGIYLVLVLVQLRFSSILYVRAMNGMRQFYGGGTDETAVGRGLWLPSRTNYPAYNEEGQEHDGHQHPAKYMFHIIQAMAILNSFAILLGLFFIPSYVELHDSVRWLVPVAVGLMVWQMQLAHYRQSATHREKRSSGKGLI